MAIKDTFGLGPLDRFAAERPGLGMALQSGNRGIAADQFGQPQQPEPAMPQIDTRQPSTFNAGRGADDLLPPTPLVPVFENAARQHNVPVNILMALGQQESSYRADVRGVQTQWGQAIGMMGYLPATARMMGINPFDAGQSIDAAARQIRDRLDKGYSMEDAVKEHFAGPNRQLWGPKTAQYGVDVLGKARAIRSALYPDPQETQSLDSMITRGNRTQGNMSTVQDGPMSIPAGTNQAELAPTSTPEDGAVDGGMQQGIDSVLAAQAGMEGDHDASLVAQATNHGGALWDKATERAVGGFDNMSRSLGVARSVLTGRWDDESMDVVSDAILKGIEENKKREGGLHDQEKVIAESLKRFGESEGIGGTLDAAGDLAKTAITNPIGLGLGTIEQAGNMLPTIAGGIGGAASGAGVGAAAGSVLPGAGTLAGAAVGGVWGSRAGMVAGTSVLEFGNEIQQAIQTKLQENKAQPTKDNIKALLADPAFRTEIENQAGIKGLTLGTIDALAFGLAGRVATAPTRAAEKRAIKELADSHGITEQGARRLLKTDAGKKALAAAKPSTAAGLAAGAGAAGIEFLGEPLGEAGSQLASRGEIDKEDVAAEALYGAGTSVATAGAARGVSAAGNVAGRMRESVAPNGDRVRWEEAPEAGAPTAPGEPPAPPPPPAAPSGPISKAVQAGDAAAIEQSKIAPEGMPPVGAQVMLAPEGIEPIVVTVDAYIAGDVSVTDQSGNAFQIPLDEAAQVMQPISQDGEIAPQGELSADIPDAGHVPDGRGPGADTAQAIGGDNAQAVDTGAALPDERAELPASPVPGVREGLANADQQPEPQPALNRPAIEDMTLEQLHERQQYLVDQAHANNGWSKKLSAEKAKIEAAISKLQPAEPAAVEQPPQVSPSSDATAEQPKPAVDIDAIEDQLIAERDEQSNARGGRAINSETPKIQAVIYDATAASTIDPADAGTFDWLSTAIENGRLDLAEYIVARAERYANNKSTTPGVKENDSRYTQIKANLEQAKATAIENARRLRERLSAAQSAPIKTTPVVTPRETDITTPQGKPLVELFYPADGVHVLVRKDQWEAGDEKLATFTDAGTDRFGAGRTVKRAMLDNPIVKPGAEAAPTLAAPALQAELDAAREAWGEAHTEANGERLHAARAAVEDAQPNESTPTAPALVRVRDVYGADSYVRQSDLDDADRVQLRRFHKDGSPITGDGRTLHRDNIDTDGSRAAQAWKDMPYIAGKNDTPFKTEAAARAAIKRHGQNINDYDLRQLPDGYVAVRKQAGDDAQPEAKQPETVDTPAGEKKPSAVSKEDAEHLFGVPQKREAALKRIDAGRAWFGDKAKAQSFITKNGLKDTHEPVQTGAKRWEPKAKDIRVSTQDPWRASMEQALQSVPDDHPMRRKWQALAKNGAKSADDRASVLAQVRAAAPTVGTAPEHAQIGVDDRELSEIVGEFNEAQALMMDDGDQVHHLFDKPKKNEIVRLHEKASVYHKDHGWMTPAEAKVVIEQWKAHAAAQGGPHSPNADKIVLSLFDLTGKWSQPWEEAGYPVFRFDIQDDPEVGDVNNFSTEFFSDWFGDFEGQDIYAILAACPCTDFASSGARHFAAKDKDGRTVSSVRLVQQTLATIEYFKPSIWAIENPVGRIEKLGGLPPWRLSFDPNQLGDPYTKKTLLWGRFNADLPIAPVEPTEGSKMHTQFGGKSQATKNARSVTPEGFAYGFFMANNAIDHPVMAIANKYDRLDADIIGKAVDAGMTQEQIGSVVDDFYYMDLDDAGANRALLDAVEQRSSESTTENHGGTLRGDDIDGDWMTFAADSGTLNIPRAEMPQIKAEHRGAMVNFLNARDIAHQEDTVPASDLKPTQAEFSRKKVEKAKTFEGGDRSILVSKDGHVLDGHHQWLAKRDAGEDVKIIRLDAPIRKLLDEVREFPSAETAPQGRDQTEAKRPETVAPPQNEGGTKSAAKPNKKEQAEQHRKLLDDYYTPGNIVKSYGGHDRVISYTPATKENGFLPSVTVQEVVREDNKWVVSKTDGRIRTHGTMPTDRELRNGPVERAEKTEPLNKAPFVSVSKEPGITTIVLDPSAARKPSDQKAVKDEAPADAAPTLSQQLAGMSNTDLAAMIDAIANEDTQVVDTAKPVAKRARRTKPKEGKAKPREQVSAPEAVELNDAPDVDRTAGEIAQSLGYNVSNAGMEAITGLTKLFGGSGKLNSGLTFDEETYAQAKPHFQAMLTDAQAAGKDITDFIRLVLQKFGTGVKPYIIRFANDQRDEPQGATNARDTVHEDGSGPLEGVETRDVQGIEGERGAERGGASGEQVSGTPDSATNAGRVSKTRSGGSRTSRNNPAAPRPRVKKPDAEQSLPGLFDVDPAAEVAQASAPNIPAINFTIDDSVELGKGTEGQKYQDNIAAIKVLKQIEQDNRRATPEEQRTLARYVGWGGLKNAFRVAGAKADAGVAKGWEKRVDEIESLLTPDELRAARNSTTAAHYTSQTVVNAVWKGAQRLGFNGGSILEPSVGTGNFIGLMPQAVRGQSQLMAVEYDSLTARIAQQLYPQSTILHSGFQNVPLPRNYFALAIGNPPFGRESLTFPHNSSVNGKSIHNQFFLASLDALTEGGVMGMVVSHNLMDALSADARLDMARKAEFVGAVRLPDTAFKENARTEVVTDIMFFRKRSDSDAKFANEAVNEIKGYKPTLSAQERVESEGVYESIRANVESWVGSQTIADPAGTDVQINVNTYFLRNPNMVVGKIDASGTMSARAGLNVRLEDQSQFDSLLNAAIERLPKTQPRDDVKERSLAHYATVADAMRLAVNRAETGAITRDADGKLKLVVDMDGGDLGKSVLREIELTANTPFNEEYALTIEGKWQRTVDVIGEDGKPAKVMGKDDKLTNRNQKKVVVYESLADIPAKDKWGEDRITLVGDMLPIRNLMKRQLMLESRDATERMIEENRTRLNAAYDKFVQKHGPLHESKVAKIALQMPDGALALAAETVTGKGKALKYGKADIMSRRVTMPPKKVERADSAADAVAISRSEYGSINVEYVAELLGTDEAGAIDALSKGDAPLAFLDPETQQWESADQYLSGLVRRKLHAAKAAGLEANIKALEAVMPEPWDSSQITPNIGSAWIPGHVYADFMKHLGYNKADVSYSSITNSFDARAAGEPDAQWATSGRAHSPSNIVSRLLNSQPMKVTFTDGEGKTHVDEEATAETQIKANEIFNEFLDWAYSDDSRRSELVDIFNEKYNTRLVRQYDGSHLRLPGKVPDTIIKMRRHQNNAIWRGIIDPAVLYDHVVGAGKTYTAVARIMERRRMGLSRKPMVIVPNHLIKAWGSDVHKLYPGAKVLVAGKADFERKNRRRLFARIASGDYDMVILGHSSFSFISIDAATEQRYIEEELQDAYKAIEEAQEAAEEAGYTGYRKPLGVAEAERLVKKLEDRLAKLREGNRDRLLTFEEMGVDDLTVDEAHEYKNLAYNSRLSGVSGMGNKTGSQKALDLHMKIRAMRERKGTAVAFLTGTPISNSVAEMFLVLRNLVPNELKEMGIDNFDAWRSMFVSYAAAYEPTESGGIKEVTRLGREWMNMKSLMDLYYSVSDAVTIEDIKDAYALDNPGEKFPIPTIKSQRENNADRAMIAVKPSPEQRMILREIVAGFEGLKGISDLKERNATRLRLMDKARKVSLDPRAVDPSLEVASKDGKIPAVVSNVTRLYQQWNADKGTQIVFLDRSVPKSKGDDKILAAYDTLVEKLRLAMEQDDTAAEASAVEALEKYNPNEMEELRNAAKGGWNAYQEIKRQLVANGIPEDEIRFVQEANTDIQKEALFGLVKSGDVRVLIGSTPRMGAGTNVQDRLVGLHHVDVTWKPSDIEQREGRIVRQGNLFVMPPTETAPNPLYRPDFEVEIIAYATEMTVDAKMWSLNATKLKAINGIRKYDGSFMMEFEDEESANMAEMAALATGNPLMVERVTLAGDIQKLELQQRSFKNRVNAMRDSLNRAKRMATNGPGESEAMNAYADVIEAAAAPIAERAAQRSVIIQGTPYSDIGEASFAAQEAIKKARNGDDKARFAIEVGGINLTSRESVDDAINKALGNPGFEGTIDGEVFIGLNEAAKALTEKVGLAVVSAGSSDIMIDGIAVNGMKVELDVSTARFSKSGHDKDITFNLVNANGAVMGYYRSMLNGGVPTVAGMRAGLSKLLDRLSPEQYRASAKVTLREAQSAEKKIPGLEEQATKPWDKTEELETKRTRLKEVIAELEKASDTARLGEDTEQDAQTAEAADGDVRYSVAPAVDTPAFKRWFGDSKVVSADGKPMVMYHGTQTDSDFSVFNTPAHFGTKDQANDISSSIRIFAPKAARGDSSRVMPVYLSISNPALIKDSGANHGARDYLEALLDAGYLSFTEFDTIQHNENDDLITDDAELMERLIEALEDRGYDGIAYENNVEGEGVSYVAFDPEQIKSATGNRGTFDAANPDIRYSVAQSVTRGPLGNVFAKLVDAGKVRVHDTVPAGHPRTAQAYTDKDGVINLVAENLTAQTARPVLLHEAFHAGGEALSGTAKWKNLNSQLKRYYEAAQRRKTEGRTNPGDYWDAALERVESARKQGAVADNRTAEEFGAYAIEEYEHAPAGIKKWVDNFIGIVKDWLNRRFGIQAGEVTPAQLRAFAIAALRNMEAVAPTKGPSGGKPVAASVKARITDSPAFKRWFGNSKVVDAAGEPMVVYHGTNAKFTEFSAAKMGSNTGWDNAKLGFFFIADRQHAEDFARDTSGGNEIVEAYLSIQKPLILTSPDFYTNKEQAPTLNEIFSGERLGEVEALESINENIGLGEFGDIFEALATGDAKAIMERDGYDGVVSHFGSGNLEYVAFRPEQIKSATGNAGAFDAANPDIRYSAKPEASNTDAHPTESSIKSYISDKLTDLNPAVLAAIPLNYFEELARPSVKPAMKAYMGYKQAMDAYRGRKHSEADAIAQKWLKLRGMNRADAKALADLMHDSTTAQSDPTDSRSALNNRFRSLSRDAQALYSEVRDAYLAQSEELDKILIENVKKSMDLVIDQADRRYAARMQQITDQGLQGDEKDKAVDAANKQYRTITATSLWSQKARITKLRQAFEANRIEGPYFPLARFGQYFVTLRDVDGSVLSFSRRESNFGMNQLANQLRKAYPAATVETGMLSNKAEVQGAMDPRFVAEVEEILSGASIDSEIKDQVWQRYLESMPDISTRKRFIHRKGTEGFEQDALRTFGHHMFHAAHQMAKLKYAPDLTEQANKVEDQSKRADDPIRAMQLSNELRKRHEWVLNPTNSRWTQIMTSTAFVWYLGVTPAAAVVNLSQTWVMGNAIIGARHGLPQTAAALLKAQVDFIAGKGSVTGAAITGDEQAAIQEAYDSGLIDRSQAHDLAGVGETGVEYNATRQKVMSKIAWLFHNAEKLNREVTALAAYRLSRKAGATHQQAIDEMHELTWKVHFDYSNSNRPRMMQNDFAKVALVFRNFQINMLYRLFRDIHQSFKGDTPQARKEARYQLAGIMGMMALNAGVKGLPFYSVAMILASLAFGGDDDPFEFEDRFREDTMKILGPELGGVVLNGVPGHYLGIDLTNRIGLPDLWFRSPNRELQGKDEYQYWLNQALGAFPGAIENMAKGFDIAADGHVARGIETAAPKFLKDLMKAWRYANEGATTIKGESYAKPEEFTPWDIIAQAVGFTPAKLVETYEKNNALKNAEAHIKDRRKELLNRYNLARKLKDDDAKAAINEKIKEFNKAFPQVRITPQTKQQSWQSRRRMSRRTDDGIVLDKRLNRSLRGEMAPYTYRER